MRFLARFGPMVYGLGQKEGLGLYSYGIVIVIMIVIVIVLDIRPEISGRRHVMRRSGCRAGIGFMRIRICNRGLSLKGW